MAEITATEELDCSGMICPLPVLKTKKAIVRMSAGEILKVTSTDPGSVADMASFSQHTGHEIIEQQEAGDAFVFYFRKA